jgi:hypothetical protein
MGGRFVSQPNTTVGGLKLMRRTDFGGMVRCECPRLRKVGIGTEALAGGLSLLKSIYSAWLSYSWQGDLNPKRCEIV